MLTDKEEIAKLEENILIDTNLTIHEVKKGQTMWITAIISRPNSSTSFNSQSTCVIKVRVVDYFWGLNKLKSLRK